LQRVIALPYTKKEKLLDVLKSILLELIKAKKTTHLQTYGYELGESNDIKKVHINLYQTQFMTKSWDTVYTVLGEALFKHYYKEYLTFL
jgi:hypothetical protein